MTAHTAHLSPAAPARERDADERRIAAAFRAVLYGSAAVLALACALLLAHEKSDAPSAQPEPAAFGWPI